MSVEIKIYLGLAIMLTTVIVFLMLMVFRDTLEEHHSMYSEILEYLEAIEPLEQNPDALDRIRNTILFLQDEPSPDKFMERMTNGIR